MRDIFSSQIEHSIAEARREATLVRKAIRGIISIELKDIRKLVLHDACLC